MADKVVVYSGTRNVYPQMYTSLKSLLINNDIDRVYLMIEDDEFTYPVPENVLIMNVSKQEFFLPGSPNFNTPYSYMELMRCALGFVLPNEKMVLWLDIDTIINEDITDLFETNMDGFLYAGSVETKKSSGIFTYVNVGVLLCNLELLRESEKEASMIAFLNQYEFIWPGQDVINLLCQGGIRQISSEYNANQWTIPCSRPKVIHYAAMKSNDYCRHWAYRKYDRIELPLEEVKTDESKD